MLSTANFLHFDNSENQNFFQIQKQFCDILVIKKL